jgi:hypothetical protein
MVYLFWLLIFEFLLNPQIIHFENATKSTARPSSLLETASKSPLTLSHFKRCRETGRIHPKPIADLDLHEPLLLCGGGINHGLEVGTSTTSSFW